MFEKNMKLSYLLDTYGSVLDERTRSVLDSYYNDDFSLSEIASGMGISRQGVRHLIKKGEDELLALERALGIAEHYLHLDSTVKLLDRTSRYLQHIDGVEADELRTLLDIEIDTLNNRLT